jgi:hypothetical protein
MKPFVCVFCGVLLAASLLMCPQAFGGTVDFATLIGSNDDPFSTYTENGFTVASTSGSWFKAFIYGNPVPDIYLGPIGAPGPGAIKVTDGGALFSFTSVDFSSNNGSSLYQIQGYKAGNLVFTEAGTEAGAFSPFSFTTVSSTSSASIDTLFISITPTNLTSFNIDNISYEVVPVPPTVWLLGSGLLGLVGWRRCRKG